MFFAVSWKVILLFLVYYSSDEVASESKCDLSSARSLNLTVNCKRDKNGEWITTFSAKRESNGTSKDINMDINHSFMNCGGRHTVYIQGVIRESQLLIGNHSESSTRKPLLFHPKCGKNARIINDGRTVEKIDLGESLNAVAITNRPLEPEELFEVRLDKKAGKFPDQIGIGVTTHSPNAIEIPEHMNYLKNGTWLVYLNNFYRNGKYIRSYYIKDLKELKVGETVAVKRTITGNLHFYFNGQDQGVAESGLLSEVYGVFELYHDAALGTIVQHP